MRGGVRSGSGSEFGDQADDLDVAEPNSVAALAVLVHEDQRVAVDGLYLDWDFLFAAGIRVDPDPASKGKLQMTANEKVILFNYSGHGFLDLAAYDAYNHGTLIDE